MPRERRWRRQFFEGVPGTPWILGVGSDQMLRSCELSRHVHKGHELTFLLDGEVSWETSTGKRLDLRGGVMGLTQPELPHWGQWQIIRPCRIIWIIVDLSRHESPPLQALDAVFKGAGDCTRSADGRLKELFLELKDSIDGYCLRPDGPLALARLKCAVEHVLALAAIKFAEAESPGREGGFLRMVERLVMAKLSRNVPVREMAKKAGFSVVRFTELFKEESGMTPADYALRLKCSQARRMLKEGRLTVTEISFRLGFSSSQHFARVFKSHMGMTPSKFRLLG